MFKWQMSQAKSYRVSESWYIVLALSIIIIVSQAISGFHVYNILGRQLLTLVRIAHLVMAVGSLLFIYIYRHKWRSIYSMTIFFTLYAPLYVTSWMRDALFSQAPVMFIPLFSYKLYPITLAFLVPGSYWINFAMIVLFYIQAAVAWYYLDIPHLNNIVLGSEPYITILFALVSFILLYFKYRDRKFIHDLIRIKVHMEAKQNISRVLLSLRDKANTPLQNQKLIIELLRKENSHSEDLINYLERSVKTLSDMSQLMSKLESETLSGSKEKLMSEEEIITYVNNVLNEKNIH